MTMKITIAPVEQFVADARLCDPMLCEIVQGVRPLVKRAAPSLTEAASANYRLK